MKKSKSSRYKKPPLRVAGVAMIVGLLASVAMCTLLFRGVFDRTVEIGVLSDRSGLVMDTGAKVQLNGVEIGRVAGIGETEGRAQLTLDIDSRQFGLLSSDTTAEIKATTAFGAKYVALTTTDSAGSRPLSPGAVVVSKNVTTEINTVFEDLTSVMQHVDSSKLNAALGAVDDGLRGRGQELGDTMVRADSFLNSFNPSMPQLQQDMKDAAVVVGTYADVAPDLLELLKYASTTSDSLVGNEEGVAATLAGAQHFGDSGAQLVGESENSLIDSMRLLAPTSALLEKYSPEIPCLLNQAVDTRDAQLKSFGGNTGYSMDLDIGLLAGDDPYRYPENLPKNDAKGGPGGSPGCYPIITKDMYPSPVLVTDTGASIVDSTDVRIGSPYFVDYLFGNTVGEAAPR